MAVFEAGRRRWARLDWVVAIAAALLSVIVMCWVGRDTWFRDDVFDFLVGREAGTAASWLRPHAGHLQIPAVGLHRLLYGAVGLDFWPWYYLPHLLGHAALSLLLWRMLLWRGTGRGAAFAAYLVLLWLGVAAFLSSIAVGGLVVLAALPLVAVRLDSPGAPSWRAGTAVAAALVLMVASSSLGLAAAAGCLAAAIIIRSGRRWLWWFLPAVAGYGAWYAGWGGGVEQGRVMWDGVWRVPVSALVLLGNAAGRLMGWREWGAPGGAVVAALLVVALGALAWKRRLRPWDLVFLGALGAYLLLVALVRGTQGSPLEAARFAYPILVLAVPLVVPHLRLPTRVPRPARLAVLLLAGGLLLGVNAWQRLVGTAEFEAQSREGRLAIETVGEALAAGEPAIDGLRLRHDLGIRTAFTLRVSDLRSFLADGWAPVPAEWWPEWEAARLRLRLFPGAPGGLSPAADALRLASEAPGGCVLLVEGERRAFTVMATGRFFLTAGGGGVRAGLAWEDRFGRFSEEVAVNGWVLVAAAGPPEGGAIVEVTVPEEGRLKVCGVTGA